MTNKGSHADPLSASTDKDINQHDIHRFMHVSQALTGEDHKE